MVWLSRHLPFHINNNITGPSTPTTPKRYRFGLFPVRSPLLRESLLFSFPPGTKMFQFSGLAPRNTWYYDFIIVGCPIRKSTDISDICSSPLLIAACHVLHRLWEPRHSPCALIYFLKYYTILLTLFQYVKELVEFNVSCLRFKVNPELLTMNIELLPLWPKLKWLKL